MTMQNNMEKQLTKEQKYVNEVLGDCSFCHNPIYEDGIFFANLDVENSPAKPYHQKCFEKQKEAIEMMVDVLKSTKNYSNK